MSNVELGQLGTDNADFMPSLFSGAEHYVAGISPSYWSHIPLLLSQLHSLKLVNGLNCLLKYDDQQGAAAFVPISKCSLVGVVIATERRSNGSVVYVIDDGTGVIDCLFWIDDGLPSLTGSNGDEDGILPIGSLVRVLGRIECLKILDDNVENIFICGRNWECRQCIREVHASRLDPLRHPQLDVERKHWEHCSSALTEQATINSILKKLGPTITQQVTDRTNLPAADDECGAWRLFGAKCRCNLKYKSVLLYCHCHATVEPRDPQFRYRDMLLEKLVDMQQALPSSEDQLRFQYRSVIGSIQLTSVGETGGAHSSDVEGRTFRALRNDGIIYLVDAASDTYLLVSCDRVLEPYLRTMTSNALECAAERAALKKNPPKYLEKVPKIRLEVLKRSLSTGLNSRFS